MFQLATLRQRRADKDNRKTNDSDKKLNDDDLFTRGFHMHGKMTMAHERRCHQIGSRHEKTDRAAFETALKRHQHDRWENQEGDGIASEIEVEGECRRDRAQKQ